MDRVRSRNLRVRAYPRDQWARGWTLLNRPACLECRVDLGKSSIAVVPVWVELNLGWGLLGLGWVGLDVELGYIGKDWIGLGWFGWEILKLWTPYILKRQEFESWEKGQLWILKIWSFDFLQTKNKQANVKVSKFQSSSVRCCVKVWSLKGPSFKSLEIDMCVHTDH